MKKQNRTKGLLPAILFFFILFILYGQNAYAAAAGSEVFVRTADTPVSSETPASCDIKVSCEWNDAGNRDGMRPEQILVELYCCGNRTGQAVTLSAADGWSGTFKAMPLYSGEERLSYSIIEEKADGYTVTISGSDTEGYRITNIHQPLPEGRNTAAGAGENSGTTTNGAGTAAKAAASGEGRIVATVVTTKVSRTAPARTSTTTQKSRSAKTADASCPSAWGLLLLTSCAALYAWMRFEQSRE